MSDDPTSACGMESFGRPKHPSKMTNQTELNELHDAMVEVGIWPEELIYHKVKETKTTTSWVEYGGGWFEPDFALHIMRGIAIDYLLEKWDLSMGGEDHHDDAGRMVAFVNRLRWNCNFSIPAALRYAHK